MAKKEQAYGVYEGKNLVRKYDESQVVSSKDKEKDGIELSPKQLAESFAEAQEKKYGLKYEVKAIKGSEKDEEPEEEADSDEDEVDYSKLTVKELAEEAEARSIELSGNEKKADLIKLLEKYDADQE